jgi:hypothetical protein
MTWMSGEFPEVTKKREQWRNRNLKPKPVKVVTKPPKQKPRKRKKVYGKDDMMNHCLRGYNTCKG